MSFNIDLRSGCTSLGPMSTEWFLFSGRKSPVLRLRLCVERKTLLENHLCGYLSAQKRQSTQKMDTGRCIFFLGGSIEQQTFTPQQNQLKKDAGA